MLPARLLSRARTDRPHRVAALALALALLAGAVGAAPALAGPVNLSNSAGPSAAPAVALQADGSAMAVWEEDDALFFARRTGLGAWSAAAAVPSAAGSGPALVAVAGGYDLVWSAFSELAGNFEVYHSRFAAGTWSLPHNLSQSAGESVEPDIAARADGARFVVWSEADGAATQVYAASSPDGTTWSSGPVPVAEGEAPRVAAGTGDVLWHLVWAESVDGTSPVSTLYAARRTAGSWTDAEIVSAEGAPAAQWPAIAVTTTGEPVVAWLEGPADLIAARRGNAGWTRTTLADDTPSLGAPDVDTGPAGAAWVAYAAGTALRLARLATDGSQTTSPIALFTGSANGATLDARPERIAVAVEGRPPAQGDVYYIELSGEGVPVIDTPGPTPTGPSSTVSPTPTATASATRSGTPFRTPTEGPPATRTGTRPPSTGSPTASPTRTEPLAIRIYLPVANKRR
jgi:hypothetical protein